ncbi:Stereocilin [Mizuhopecten yessoensis]|uniref:Stereocilin n=2 Tax=Mizuhopecten yessoensis TaxID=6573 RepID=A0A210PV39_MIZYE|nr:Stereocilin [Mizuhopecten yessoensis]
MALDEYGDILSTFTAEQVWLTAFQQFKEMGTFKIDIQIATCDGFKSFFGAFAVLTTAVKTNLANFLADPSIVTAAQIEQFPGEIFSMLKSEVQTRVFSGMTLAQKGVVCNGWKSKDCLTKIVIKDLLSCVNILESNGVTLTTDEKKKIVDTDSYDTWSEDEWITAAQQFPEVLNKAQYMSMPITVMVETMVNIKAIAKELQKGAIFAIKKRLKEYMLSQMLNVTSATQRDWVDLMKEFGAEPKLFSDVLGVAASLSQLDMAKVTKEYQVKFLEENKDDIDMSALSSSQIIGLISGLTESDMLLLNVAALETAAPAIFLLEIDPYQMRKILNVFRTNLPSYFNPSSFDAAKMAVFAPVMGYLSDAEFESIQDSVLLSGMSNVASFGKTSRKTASKMMKALIDSSGSNGALSSNDIKTLGVNVVLDSLEVDGISKVPAASFTKDIIADIEKASDELDMSAAVKSKLFEKMVEGAGLTAVLESPSLAREVPISLLLDGISSMTDIAGENTKIDIVVTIKQARFLKEEMDKLSVTLTLQRINNILPYTCALTNEQINGIEKDSFYFDILNKLTESSCVTIDMISFLHNLIKEYLSFDSTSAADLQAITTTSTLANMSPKIMAKFTQDDLNKYGSAMCLTIVEQLGLADINLLSKTELQAKYLYSITCLSKTTGTITADDLLSIGNMVCGMTTTDYVRLDNDALEQYVMWMQRTCPMSNAERQALVNAFVAAKGLTNSIKTYEIIMLGTLFPLLPQTVIDSITVDTVLDIAGPIQDEYNEKKKCTKSRKQSGKSNEFSSDDETAFVSGEQKFYTKIAKALDTKANAGSRRRRRSTASLTCSNIQVLGAAGVSALSTTQLSSLADQEFTSCIETLGSVTDYSDAQKTALLDVATRSSVLGAPSTWSTTNVYNTGVICQALTEAQIGTLTLDLDAVSRLGQFDGWDSLKKKAVFERWLSLLKGGDSSTITSSELRSLGHITCGATTSHIDVIPHAIYKNAADSIGELTSCDDTQLQSFAALAKAAYGSDVTTWLSSVISNIGITIGGLPTSDIGMLSTTQIDAIDSIHISHIPPATFAGFTVEQFLTFSTSQLSASTADQRSSLSESQLAALSADFSSTSDNGAGTVTSSVMLALVLSLAVVYQ